MRHRILHAVAALSCASAALAWAGADNGLTLASDSRLWIEGTSTVRDFKCTSTSLQATVDAGSDAVRALMGGDKAITNVSFAVATRSLDCGNGTMNGHMLNALNEKAHPEITFRLASYELAPSDSGRAATLTGALAINGTAKTITLPVELRVSPDGGLRVTGKYELDMKDYGVKPPTLMLGTLKVGEKVTVNFDLLLKS